MRTNTMAISPVGPAARGAMLLAAGTLAACQARAGAGTGRAPLLTAVSPTQVTVAGGTSVLITVRGHGFDARNRVHFGALRMPDVPSLSDSVLQFAAPIDDTFLPDRGPAPVQPLVSGRYDVRVENRRGTSNAIAITVAGGRDVR
jgi:hypothetical protein